jgi:hypothetical protein
LEVNSLDNLPAGLGASVDVDKNRERCRPVNIGKFSESQRSEYDKVRDHLQAHRREYERHGGNIEDMAQTFAVEIRDHGAKARDLIQGLGR